MNTLLGELATLNDIQYPRYRIAFKLRRLQKSLLLDQMDMGLLQEALHLSGVGSLTRKEVVPVSQLRSAVSELYSCLRVQRPVLGAALVHQAQELCSNWLQMNYQCSTGGKVEGGSLKVTLCILIGAKLAEKARYVFSVLANSNGAVECCDLAYFCTVTQQLAGTLQEQLYKEWAGPEKVWRDCLVYVRSAEDIEDDEYDGGGIKRQWLSQFEFCKIFATLPEPVFLNWFILFHRMPAMEKVLHPVRCAICTRKPIIAFRYQCTQCNNFNLCQMCFLKGRVTDKHTEKHQMMEFCCSSKGQKTWHSRLLGTGSRARGGRVWNELKSSFIYSPRSSVSSLGRSGLADHTDSPMHAIEDMLSSSQKYELSSSSSSNDHAHKPTMICIGNGNTQSKSQSTKCIGNGNAQSKAKLSPQKQAPPSSSHQKKSSVSTTSSGSPDSTSSGGGKFQYEPPLSSASSGATSSASDLHVSPAHSGKPLSTSLPQDKVCSHPVQRERKAKGQQEDLTEINRRLSMELDMLLNDLPPPPNSFPAKPPTIPLVSTVYRVPVGGHEDTPLLLHNLQAEEKVLEGQVTSLTSKREQLAGELEGLISQVHSLHSQSLSMSRGIRTPSPSSPISPQIGPAHSRSDSLPAEAYLNSTPSPPAISPLLQRKMHGCGTSPTRTTLHGSHQLLNMTSELPDPLAEYKPTDLDWNHDGHAYTEMHRVSVAW